MSRSRSWHAGASLILLTELVSDPQFPAEASRRPALLFFLADLAVRKWVCSNRKFTSIPTYDSPVSLNLAMQAGLHRPAPSKMRTAFEIMGALQARIS
jgi:hypothetical protein